MEVDEMVEQAGGSKDTILLSFIFEKKKTETRMNKTMASACSCTACGLEVAPQTTCRPKRTCRTSTDAHEQLIDSVTDLLNVPVWGDRPILPTLQTTL